MSASRRFRRRVRGQSTEITRNPMFTKPTWQSYVIRHFTLLSWIVIIGMLSIIYWLFYSSSFQIQTIQMNGANSSLAIELNDTVISDQLNAHRLAILPQFNLISFDSHVLKNRIMETYRLDTVTIKKDFPNRLVITIVEKEPALIWYSIDTYYFLDQQGSVASMIEDSAQTDDAIPQVIDTSNEPIALGQELLQPHVLEFITEIHAWVRNDGRITIFNYSLPTRLSTQLSLHVTDKPYVIYFDTSADQTVQIEKLKRILDEDLILEKNPLEYIDVRIGDRVYFK